MPVERCEFEWIVVLNGTTMRRRYMSVRVCLCVLVGTFLYEDDRSEPGIQARDRRSILFIVEFPSKSHTKQNRRLGVAESPNDEEGHTCVCGRQRETSTTFFSRSRSLLSISTSLVEGAFFLLSCQWTREADSDYPYETTAALWKLRDTQYPRKQLAIYLSSVNEGKLPFNGTVSLTDSRTEFYLLSLLIGRASCSA